MSLTSRPDGTMGGGAIRDGVPALGTAPAADGVATTPVGSGHPLVAGLLELVAEGARNTLGATSLTISWRNPERGTVHLLASAESDDDSESEDGEGTYLLEARFTCRKAERPHA